MASIDLTHQRATASHWQSLTALAAALSLVCLAWSLADGRIIDGAPNWLKPLKFSLSFAVLFATIALLEQRLSLTLRNGRSMRVIAFVMGLAFVSEMGWIIHQAAVGRASHFNVGTPLEALMYGTVMALGALALVVCIGVIGWLVKRDTDADLGPATREGIWLGFVISFLATLVVAGVMSEAGRHVGLHPEGGATLPLLGWSGVTGDLRPAHFLSLHAMQILPLIGLWRDHAAPSGPVAQVRLAAGIYLGLTLVVFGQAMLGLPLIPLG